nr:mechanosensitive ion channel family protein [Candidatus Gracilibacteria bacterium]
MSNYLYIILGISYFVLFYLLKDFTSINSFLNNVNYSVEILSYFNAIIAVITSIGGIGLFTKYLEKLLNKYFKKNKTLNLVGDAIIKFISISKYIIAIYLGIKLAIIPSELNEIINKFFKVSFIIAIIILSNSLVSSILKGISKGKEGNDLSKQVFPILSRFIIIFIWIVGGLTILGNLGYNISALITGAGVGGIAIALAAQKSVSNIFGALSIIINKPFKVGEFVRINGFTGTVKEIGLTYLELRDTTGNKILIPNETLISTSIENLTQRDNRRNDFIIGLVYETSLEKLKKAIKILEDILEKYVKNGTLESYRVNFDNFGDSSLNINGTYFSLLNDDYKAYIKQKEEINLEIKRLFEKEGLEMAFPTQEIRLKK